MSTPAAVKVGAEPPGKSTDAGKFTVCEPPLVNINIKVQALPLGLGFEKVKVCVPVDTVAVKTLPCR